MKKLKKQITKTKKQVKDLAASAIPVIKIISTKELPNGELEIVIDYDEDWVEIVKKDLGKNRVSKKDIEKHFVDTLKKGIERLDGYDIKKVNEVKD